MDDLREQRTDTAFQKLVTNLDDMTKSYRTLLEVVRKEKELLVASQVEQLQDNNSQKEALLHKVRALDVARERYAKDLGGLVGCENPQPRLLEIAQKMAGQKRADDLRNLHSTLEILVRRSQAINTENEAYVQAAIQQIDGALDNVKDTLAGKKVYQKGGKLSYGPEKAGNFVRKQG
jgi:flagellar biosynthesis/type III secretory pathway chaperone